MKLGKYHLALLRIIKDNPNSSPHKIDRLFYQIRIDEGIATSKIYLVSWTELMKDLKRETLVENDERSITSKGVEYLAKHL